MILLLNLAMLSLPEAAKEHVPVAEDDAGGDEPLAAVREQERAEDLDEDQSDEQVGDATHGAGHDGPTVVQGTGLLALFIAMQGQILEDAKNDANGATRNQGEQDADDIHNHKLQHNFAVAASYFKSKAAREDPPTPRAATSAKALRPQPSSAHGRCFRARHIGIPFDHRRLGLFVHDHAGIPGHPHLGHVQPFDLDVASNAVADQLLTDGIDDQRDSGQGHEAGGDADQLGPELAQAAAIEEAFDGAGNGIPAIAISAVCKEAQGETTPGAVDAMDGDGADRIVNPALVEKEYGFHDQDAGNQPDEAGAASANKGTGTGDSDQAGEHAVAHHGRVGFFGPNPPHPEGRAQGAGRGSEHSVDSDDGDAEFSSGKA